MKSLAQPSLFEIPQPTDGQDFSIQISPDVADLLTRNAPVALGVSGGKDSSAMSLAVMHYLQHRGHQGPVILIHSDLGRVEWRESLPMCQRLADHLGIELVVVRRQAGDLLDRWQVRWHNNVARYANLETIRLVLPWSTPGMLFCRSELKAAIICRELVQRFPGKTVVSATGIRREESAARAHAPISSPQPRLTNKTHQTHGVDWRPIRDRTLDKVFAYHRYRQFPLHPAYARGMSRVSCAYCVVGSLGDLETSAGCPENQDLYREQVDLEIISSYSFQSGRWLGDIAPQLLSEEQRQGLAEAKRRAAIREQAEARIPHHLLYVKGWPTVMPTVAEARLLAEVRSTVADTLLIDIQYRDAESILARYAQLMKAQTQKKQTSRNVLPLKPSSQVQLIDLW